MPTCVFAFKKQDCFIKEDISIFFTEKGDIIIFHLILIHRNRKRIQFAYL